MKNLLLKTKSGVEVFDCGNYLELSFLVTEDIIYKELMTSEELELGDIWKDKKMLLKCEFESLNTGDVIKTAIIKGKDIPNSERTHVNIQSKAYSGKFTQGKKLFEANITLAFLICRNITNEEMVKMGLHEIIIMHQLIQGVYPSPCPRPCLLFTHCYHDRRFLGARFIVPEDEFGADIGFAFQM